MIDDRSMTNVKNTAARLVRLSGNDPDLAYDYAWHYLNGYTRDELVTTDGDDSIYRLLSSLPEHTIRSILRSLTEDWPV